MLDYHEQYMREAIKAAQENPRAPFGSVLVDNRSGEIVARGVNASKNNPVLHGELAAIDAYAELGLSDWQHLSIYTTAEPCCMCQGAILWSGIDSVNFGVSIADLKQLGWRQIDIACQDVTAQSWNPGLKIQGSICHQDCMKLFIDAKS